MPQPLSSSEEHHELARWLEESRQSIVSEWTEAVRDDPSIPNADQLTLAALQDHFPQLLAELVEGLRTPSTLVDSETRRTADEHGTARWRHGYRLDELLRELARIRELVLARVQGFCESRGLSTLRNEADEKVRRFFDTIVASSARQYMREREAEVNLRSQQLHEAYEQVRVATEDLREIARSRLRLLRGVSHELRNALQALSLGASELIHEGREPQRSTILTGIKGSAANLERVLDRLQQFSTILAGDTKLCVEMLDLREFLQTIEKQHRPSAERKGLQFEVSTAADLMSVETDAEKLHHIADILLANAVQYTNEGSVVVTTKREEADRWSLMVVDDGIGFDEVDAQHAFREFHHRRRSPDRGVGLGLVIARHLAQLLHGEIIFQSTPGKGSRFEVNLPIKARA